VVSLEVTTACMETLPQLFHSFAGPRHLTDAIYKVDTPVNSRDLDFDLERSNDEQQNEQILNRRRFVEGSNSQVG